VPSPIDKKELRKKSLTERLQIPAADYQSENSLIVNLASSKILELGVETVFLFFSYKMEPDLSELPSRHPDLKFSYPVISQGGGDMEFYSWAEAKEGEQEDELTNNKWGIKEPLVDENSAPSIPDSKTLIIVPSVCLDRYGYRLGYGGGYYDRFLNACPESATLGICSSRFLIEDVPVESWDRQLTFICTEREILQP